MVSARVTSMLMARHLPSCARVTRSPGAGEDERMDDQQFRFRARRLRDLAEPIGATTNTATVEPPVSGGFTAVAADGRRVRWNGRTWDPIR